MKKKDEYEPFGDEWKKEMMKLTKSELIDFIKRIRMGMEKQFKKEVPSQGTFIKEV